LAGSWKRQTSATAKLVSIDFPTGGCVACWPTTDKVSETVRVLALDSAALSEPLQAGKPNLPFCEWRLNRPSPRRGAAFDTAKWLCYFPEMNLRVTGCAKRDREILLVSVGFLLLLAALAGCGRKSSRRTSQASQNAIAAAGYKSKIEVSKVGLAKGENYLGSEVFYVEGSLKNTGNRVVQRVEITFLFKDSLKQVVLKESRKALEYKGSRGLEADKSTRFQVAFDHLPKDWNYVLPDLEVSEVTLKE